MQKEILPKQVSELKMTDRIGCVSMFSLKMEHNNFRNFPDAIGLQSNSSLCGGSRSLLAGNKSLSFSTVVTQDRT